MVEIWRSVLGRPELDATADFFATGGDSLAAVEIVTRIGDLVGHEVPIAMLLTAPTPAGMATALDVHQHTSPQTTPAVQLVTMRSGAPDGPLLLLTAAWDDVQGYRDLADALPDHVTAVAAVVIDRSGALDRVDSVVDAIVPALEDLVERDRVGVVGWSIGGVVAFELGQRLTRAGAPVRGIGLVDTYFPGEQRHLWSNRWWKYKSMLRPGGWRAAGGELVIAVRRRAIRVAADTGRRLLAWAGEEVEPPAPRATPGGIPFDAMDHTPTPGPVPVTLYSASTTNPARTSIPWRRVAPDLRVVPVTGRHRGHDSIMSRARVDIIADDLVAQLGD
jgi:dienelactone hydrolase